MIPESTKRGAMSGLLGVGVLLVLVSFFTTWGAAEFQQGSFVNVNYDVQVGGADWSFRASGFGMSQSDSGSCDWFSEPDKNVQGENPCGPADGADFGHFLVKLAPITLGLGLVAGALALLAFFATDIPGLPKPERWHRYTIPSAVAAALFTLGSMILLLSNVESSVRGVEGLVNEAGGTFAWAGGVAAPILAMLALAGAAVVAVIPEGEDAVAAVARIGLEDDASPVARKPSNGGSMFSGGGAHSPASGSSGTRGPRDASAARDPYRSDPGAATSGHGSSFSGASQAPAARGSPDPYGSAPAVESKAAADAETDSYGTPAAAPGEPVKALQCPRCKVRFDAPIRRPLFVKCPECGKSALLHQ